MAGQDREVLIYWLHFEVKISPPMKRIISASFCQEPSVERQIAAQWGNHFQSGVLEIGAILKIGFKAFKCLI